LLRYCGLVHRYFWSSSMPNTKPGTGQNPPPTPASADDRPQHEDEYLSKFLQTPTPENKSKDGKEAEPVNTSPDSKPGAGGSGHSQSGRSQSSEGSARGGSADEVNPGGAGGESAARGNAGSGTAGQVKPGESR
jgi:hypothetical protein